MFLPGLGNTARVRQLRPSFTDRFHVVALTRRGFGESSHPETGTRRRGSSKTFEPRSTSCTWAEDSHRPFDRRRGDDTLCRHVSGSSRKLVYLDAAYDRVAADSMLSEIFLCCLMCPPRPQPTAADGNARGVRRLRAPNARRHPRVRHPHAVSLRRLGESSASPTRR